MTYDDARDIVAAAIFLAVVAVCVGLALYFID